MTPVIRNSVKINYCDGIFLCVNLDRLRDTQRAGKKLFPGVFLEEVSIWMGKLNKGHSHQDTWASRNSSGAWIEQKGRERVSLLFKFELKHPFSPALGDLCSSFSGLQTQTGTYSISPWILGPLVLYRITPLAFLRLWLAESRGLLRLQNHSSYNKSPHLGGCSQHLSFSVGSPK